MIIQIVVLVSVQLVFAFACVSHAKRKGRLNNWWVLFAAFVPILPYLIIRKLPHKENEAKLTEDE